MQQRLMLGRRAMRRRDRRHRLNALALARHQQAGAIMPQRFLTVLVPNHTRKPLDISHKSRFTVVSSSVIHLSPQADVNLNKNLILQELTPRLSDSVKLESVRRDHAGLHSFLNISLIEARRRNASAFRLRFSQSLASRRQRPSHANVRSTTHRFGSTTKPLA